jgi:negative regulator of sigma E activity
VRADLRDALSALADGEVADPQLVAEALLEPDAATLIVTLAEARATLRDTTSQPADAVSIRIERALARDTRPALVVIRKVTPALYAGLALAAGVLVGVLLAPAGTQPTPPIVAAAAPAVVTVAPPAPPSFAPTVAAPQAGPRKMVPPAAKSRYRFEVGRNWREGSRP